MAGDHPGLSREDFERWVAEAGREYRSEATNRVWSVAARTALGSLRGARDYQDLLRRSDEHLQELALARAALERVRARVESAADWHDTADCFCDIWLERRRREVLRGVERSPGQGRRAWLDAYAGTLARDGYEACRGLTLQPWARSALGGDVAALARFRTGAVALRDDRPGDAVAMLTELAEDQGKGAAGSDARGVAMVLLARIHLYRLSDLRSARHWCDRGLKVVGPSGRLYAALGECLRAEGSVDEAERAFLAAIDADPSLPDGYVGMGLLSQDGHRWHQSRDWYDDALDAVGDSGRLGVLLAPTPGNLHWQRGRRLRSRDPVRALEALDCALRLGVAWWKGHPKRKVFADRGDVLVLLERPREAGHAYYESGRRYCWIGEARAGLPLLRRAIALDPEHAAAHWQLADALRLLSYRPEFPYVEEGLARESAEAWEHGTGLRRPDAATAWAFLIRALLNEQLEKLTDRLGTCYWQTVRLLEQAVLLNPSYATAWAYLGQHHRLLRNLATARQATERALALDPTDVSALEQHAAVLLEQADYAGAERLALRRLDRAPEPFPQLVAATAMLMAGRTEPALQVLDAALAAVPDDLELRACRALARTAAGRPDLAREDHEVVWEHRDGPLPRDVGPLVARAGLHLGHVEAAVDRYADLLEGDFHGSVPLSCELGLALLVRGDAGRDDRVRAAELLRTGVRAADSAHELRLLAEVLVPAVRGLLDSGLPDQVRGLLDEVARSARAAGDALAQHPRTAAEELADALSGDLPPVEGPDRPLAAAAGLARLALAEGRAEAAAERYADLVRSGDLPEAEPGLLRAVERLRDGLDARGADRLGSVRDDARRFARLLEPSFPAQRRLLAELRARAGMAALLLGDRSDGAHLRAVTELLPGEDGVVVTTAAGQHLVTTTGQYWIAVDRLEELAGDPGLGEEEAEHFRSSARRLDLSRLLPLAATAVDLATVSPIAPPLVLRFGPGVARTVRAGVGRELDDALARLRKRVESDTGIRVPGVLVEEDGDLEPLGYAIDVRGPVSQGVLRPDDGDGLRAVVDELEAHARRRLPSLLRLDDVAQGLSGRPGLSRDSALRVRVYRALQVLVADGLRLTPDLLTTLAGEADARDAPDAARSVRLRLRHDLPGNTPGAARERLPEDLAARLERGMQPGAPARWQLPRAEAVALLADIRDWWESRPPGPPRALVVPRGEVRPFAVRLLAADLPGVPVLSEEEQHDREDLPVAGEPAPAAAAATATGGRPPPAGAP